MGVFDRFFKSATVIELPKMSVVKDDQPTVTRLGAEMYQGHSRVLTTSYNGEKNLGEMGPIKSFMLDYEGLRKRSWQAYLESEVAQILMNKFATWALGSGLKLQSEPSTRALEYEGISVDKNKFSEEIEARFALFCESSESNYNGMGNLFSTEAEAFINSRMGGDVLVVLRYSKGNVNVQLIDGAHVHSPGFGTDRFPQVLENGNRIVNGIELDSKNQHVAYHVRKNDLSYETDRIAAKGNTGLVMAYLVYGSKYRLNNSRGIPKISGVLETLKKLERYKEATVGSAEERQKIAYFIEHQLGSTGESPLLNNLHRAWDVEGQGTGTTADEGRSEEQARTIASSTNKQTFNLTPNSTLKSLDSKNELYFKDFYQVNIDIVCAVFEMPPNVAMSKYDSNFSASRAALKDWELVLRVTREKFSREFWQPIYNLFLEVLVLQNKIQAPGYIQAKKDNNYTVIEAYRKSRFVGPSVPHIDPLKEVMAERAKLGELGKNLPFTDLESSVENLNQGESQAILEQFSAELERARGLGIPTAVPDNAIPPASEPA